MKTVFANTQLGHSPQRELSDGQFMPAVEIGKRAEAVLQSIKERGIGDVIGPEAFPVRALQRIHTPDYVTFLEEFWEKWLAAGRTGEAFPFVWPIRSLRMSVMPKHIDGLLGRYSMDAGTALGEKTYESALASSHTALTAAKLVLDGESAAFGLCRPPGHHAGTDFFGGYCFFNNAAVAAQWLRDNGLNRIAILDVDYHHGNGTQAIFYDRPDVLFLSIHADPSEEFPYFLGHADETGEHAGTGFTRNWPLPLGTDWEAYQQALDDACRWLRVYKPDMLIVSLGLDCYEDDPISQFKFKSEDFFGLGKRIAQAGFPTLFLMEGGYAVDALGDNCANVLEGFGH